ncbi:MAG TPA: hypothetical protein VIM69_09985 [Opitutaceae bacterium]
MALWEYKVITSGPHGFASPALLETHLNNLAKDEWEIVIFQTQPNNPLAFNGLARRATVRDWSPPPETAAAPASAPAQPTQAKSYEPTKPVAAGPARAEEPAQAAEEKTEASVPSREESLRTYRDTERDSDPDAEDEDWDNWDESEDALPTFFEALKPHLRRNQKGVGMSVAVDYLAKRWEQKESDLVGALKECGFTIPESEETDPDYFEFEGDLYWVNRNNRGQLFINTREKPRPVFRIAQAKKLDPNDPATAELVAERSAEKAEIEKRKTEREERAARQAAAQAAAAAAKEANQGPAISDQEGGEPKAEEVPSGPLPTGQELLDRIRPLMRRNRRGPGYSGSVSFLARALKHSEADLAAGLAALGLNPPANPSDKPVYVEITDGVYWMNKDNRGGIWINGREKREGAPKPENGSGENANAAAAANGESTITPTDANAGADSVAQTAAGAAAVSTEGSSANGTDGAKPVKSEEKSASENLSSPTDAQVEGVPPAREVVPEPAQTPAASGEAGSNQVPAAATEAGAAEANTPEEGTKPKSSRPRRSTSSRPRTRKPKADSEGATPAVPESDMASDET